MVELVKAALVHIVLQRCEERRKLLIQAGEAEAELHVPVAHSQVCVPADLHEAEVGHCVHCPAMVPLHQESSRLRLVVHPDLERLAQVHADLGPIENFARLVAEVWKECEWGRKVLQAPSASPLALVEASPEL